MLPPAAFPSSVLLLRSLTHGLPAPQRQRQAGLHRAPAPNLRLDSADSDRLGPEQALRPTSSGTPISRRFPAGTAKGSAARGPVRRRSSRRPQTTPTPPTSSWRCARVRSQVAIRLHHLEGPRRSTRRWSSGLARTPARRRRRSGPISRQSIPYNALAYQGTAYALGRGLQPRRLGVDRQPQCRDHRRFRRLRRERNRRRPGAGHQRFPDQRPIWRGLQSGQHRFDDAVRLGRRRIASRPIARRWASPSRPRWSARSRDRSILARWLQILSCAAVWSGGLLKFIPYGDTAISAGPTTTYQTQFSIPAPVPESSTSFKPPSFVTVCAPQNFVSDGGVVYAFNNVPFVFIGAASADRGRRRTA